MGLTTCPDCGRQVSTAADACPECGRPMRARSPLLGGSQSGEGCFLQTLNAGCIVIFAVLLALIFGIAESC